MNATPPLSCVILAAGLGTRMRSAHAKVLHPAAGLPLVAYPVGLASELGARTVLVLGHQAEEVERAVRARFPELALAVARQEKQLGTGHAVAQAAPLLQGATGPIVILYGDAPLLTRATLERLVEAGRGRDLALVTARPADAAGYGRIVRDERGRLVRIIEQKDATETERAIGEVNAGFYCIEAAFLWSHVGALGQRNAQGEIYLTDLAAIAAARGEVATVEAAAEEMLGVNDRAELAHAEAVLYRRRSLAAMRAGVTLHQPASVSLGPDVEIAADAEIGPNVAIEGRSVIGPGARIEAGCVLRDATIAARAHLKPYCVVTGSSVGEGAQIGPFAHLRPESEIGAEAHVGNFVETKKTRLGDGAKANHLSYLGDADIGARVNVGAGTITCNYDGVAKHQTVIEDGAFIGSDSQLVAPVRVGRGAYVGSGTTVVKDVPADALALSRPPQINKAGWAARKRAERPAK